jgi:hypothetical protein
VVTRYYGPKVVGHHRGPNLFHVMSGMSVLWSGLRRVHCNTGRSKWVNSGPMRRNQVAQPAGSVLLFSARMLRSSQQLACFR